jgi:glutamine synthetase
MSKPDISYTLANPLSVLLNKSPYDFQRKDFLEVVGKKQIERITFHYTALDGKLKELKIPVSNSRQVEFVLAEGERVDGSSLFKGMVDSAISDLYVIPVYRTAFLNPFDEGSLDFICRYVTKDGELSPFALDTILSHAIQVFHKNTGLKLYALGELEFYLLSDKRLNIFPAQKQQGYQSSSPYIKSGQILNEMIHHMTQITGAIKYAHSEAGFVESVRSDLDEINGKMVEQLEVEYLPKSVEEMADDLVLGRWLIRNIAYKYGCVATFTPKLEEGVAGNGMHIHVELIKDGKNTMVGPDGQLSESALKLIGGLCEYADSLTAFGNTVSSAYLRMVPNLEAPTRICWSDLNRSAMIRVPLGWANQHHLAKEINPQEKSDFYDSEGRQTVELRSPDGSAIVHLLLAGIVMAADWALKDNLSFFKEKTPLELAKKLYIKGNEFATPELQQKLPALPTNCVDSSRILLKKRELYEREGVFPSSVIDYTVRFLQAENDELMNKRLADLPADDRLHEMRKIMHKDLHRH